MVFIQPSLRWLTRELTGCMIIIEILRWIIRPFARSCADHTGKPSPGCGTALGAVSGETKHISLQVQRKPILALGSPCAPTMTCGEQISPGNPWGLLILRVNSMTLWARKPLLLTTARLCGVRGHRSCVFLLAFCIEFKQDQHSCGNTLLQLRRTPREKVLSSLGVMAHKLFFPSLSVSLRSDYTMHSLHSCYQP